MNSSLPLWVAFGAAFLTTLAATPLVRGFARRLGLVAAPSADRWHAKPTALLGGIAVYAGFLAGAAIVVVDFLRGSGAAEGLSRTGVGIILAATLMFLVGLADDRLKLRPTTKLIFQSLAAAILISFGVLYPVTPWTTVNVLITFFWFLALTNALNLLDNMDGVAVGVAGIAALFLAMTFAWEQAWFLTSICLAFAGATAGFLPYNFHRASIFMGDSGSLFLGAILAGMGAAYPSEAPASIVSVLFVPALIVIIPILDTVLVTVTRTVAGHPISVGGRDHTSHRLVAMGLSERQVALLLYGFAICGGGMAMLLRGAPTPVGLSVGAVFLVALLIVAGYLGRMHSYAPSERPSGPVTLLVSDLLYKRRAFEVILDLILFAVAYQAAYLLRWDGTPPLEQEFLFESTLAAAVVAKSVAFGLFGVYRGGSWHRISIADVHRLVMAAAAGSLLTVAVLAFFFPGGFFSRSIFVLDGMLVALLAVGARASFRSLEMVRHSLDQVGVPTLLYGAGSAGELVVREMLANKDLSFRPVGFIDDNQAKRGRLFHGYPVLGGIEELEKLVRRREVRSIVLCSKKLEPHRVEHARQVCKDAGVEMLELHLGFRPILDGAYANEADERERAEVALTPDFASESVRRRVERTA